MGLCNFIGSSSASVFSDMTLLECLYFKKKNATARAGVAQCFLPRTEGSLVPCPVGARAQVEGLIPGRVCTEGG